MSSFRKLFTVVFCLCLASLVPCAVHAQSATPTRAPEVSDAAVLASLCFQCHGATVWIEHRTDRRGWEGVLYRMVGRGALWTEDEISRMANALSAQYGPGAARVTAKPGSDAQRSTE
jgi:hypothetical protein